MEKYITTSALLYNPRHQSLNALIYPSSIFMDYCWILALVLNVYRNCPCFSTCQTVLIAHYTMWWWIQSHSWFSLLLPLSIQNYSCTDWSDSLQFISFQHWNDRQLYALYPDFSSTALYKFLIMHVPARSHSLLTNLPTEVESHSIRWIKFKIQYSFKKLFSFVVGTNLKFDRLLSTYFITPTSVGTLSFLCDALEFWRFFLRRVMVQSYVGESRPTTIFSGKCGHSRTVKPIAIKKPSTPAHFSAFWCCNFHTN